MDRTTELLSSYACRLSYEDLPPEVVHQVKRTLIDTLGCAIGGYDSEPAEIARKLALRAASAAPSRVIGSRQSATPELAGFANGVALRYLDCNDSYFSPGGGHPSDMIAAAFAIGDPLQRSGQDIITAIVVAYELFCRLSDQVIIEEQGWDQGLFSVIGAAAAAGKLLGLTQEQMGHALSLAVTPHLPTRATRRGELPMWKGCAAASATQSAIFAALLAQEGMTGPFEPFDGRNGVWEQTAHRAVKIEDIFGGNEGRRFAILDTTFKFYPSQIHTQAPIGVALELRRQVKPADIAAIRIETYARAASSAATEPQKWNPQTRETADHSIPYLAAVALQDGAVNPASFTEARIKDPALRPLINKISIVENPEFTARYPRQYNCRIQTTTHSGHVLTAETNYPKGHRENPLDNAALEAKFRNLAAGAFSAAQCDHAFEILWRFEDAPNPKATLDAVVIQK